MIDVDKIHTMFDVLKMGLKDLRNLRSLVQCGGLAISHELYAAVHCPPR